MKALAALAIALLAVVSCKPRPQSPPAETAAQPAAKVPADPSDPASYLGLTEQEATATAEKAGIPSRVTEVDGQPKPATMDYRPDRLNFIIAKGKVIRVTRG